MRWRQPRELLRVPMVLQSMRSRLNSSFSGRRRTNTAGTSSRYTGIRRLLAQNSGSRKPSGPRTASIYVIPLSNPLPRRRLGRQRRQPPELFQNCGAERDRPGVRVVEVLWLEAPGEVGAKPGCQDLRRNALPLDERDSAFRVLARQPGPEERHLPCAHVNQ